MNLVVCTGRLIIVALLFVVTRVLASTIYVSSTAFVTGTGSASSPKQLGLAIKQARTGDLLLIGAGTYRNVAISISVVGITIKAVVDTDRPILLGMVSFSGVAPKILRVDVPNVTLDGLVLRDGPGGGIQSRGSGLVVRNVEIDHCGWGVTTEFGGSGILTGIASGNVVIDRCYVHGCREHGIYLSGAAHDTTISNSTLSGNKANGLQINPAGVPPSRSRAILIFLCSFTGNGSRGMAILSTDDSTFRMNTFSGNDIANGGRRQVTQTIDSRRNIWKSNSPSGTLGIPANQI